MNGMRKKIVTAGNSAAGNVDEVDQKELTLYQNARYRQ